MRYVARCEVSRRPKIIYVAQFKHERVGYSEHHAGESCHTFSFKTPNEDAVDGEIELLAWEYKNNVQLRAIQISCKFCLNIISIFSSPNLKVFQLEGYSSLNRKLYKYSFHENTAENTVV